jgi:hypothetical protein
MFLSRQRFADFFCCYSAVIGRCFFRCYLAAGGFKKPEFLRPGEEPPLYFAGIITGISECGDP